MYCATCELEVKGDDKDTCPVCGGPLSDSHEDDSAAADQDSEGQAGAEGIFDDASSVESQQEPSSAETDQEDVFVLQDYPSESFNTDEAATSPEGSDELPLLNESVQKSAGDVNDLLDSIRESITTPGRTDEEKASEGGELDNLDVDFGSFDSFDQNTSTDAASENTTDESADISWGNDEAASAVPMADAPQRKRSPVIKIVLIIALIAVGGFYLFTLSSDDEAPLVNELAKAIVVAEPELEDNVEIAESSVEAEVEAPVAPEEAESVISAEVVVAGQDETVKPSVVAEVEAPVATEEAESVVTAESAVAGEGETAKPSVEAEVEAPVAPEEAESVVSAEVVVFGESEAAKPSVEVKPEAPVVSEKAEVVVPVKPEPVMAPFFTVHVGSYQKRVSASSEVVRIEAKGYDAFIERVDLGKKGIWYRVKVGRFKNRAEAEQLQKIMQKAFVPDSMVVTQRTN